MFFHSTLIDDRQHDMRRVLSRMQHGLLGRLHPGAGRHIFPGVQIAAEAREVAAADIEPQAVPGQKRMARRTEFDLEFVDLARLQKFRLSQAFAIAPPQYALAEHQRTPFPIDIGQPRRKVRVQRGRCRIEHHLNWTDDDEILGQCRRSIDQHISASFNRPLVDRTGQERIFSVLAHHLHRQVSAAGRHRILRVVRKAVGWLISGQLLVQAAAVGIGLRPAVAMHIVRHEARTRQRPLVGATPSD